MQALVQFLPLILLIVVMYFLLIRPQKKKEKAVAEMRNSVRVGDEVVTIGGICGKIVKTKDETLVIQVGADKVKFEIMRWAVSKVTNQSDRPASASERKERAVEEDDEPKKTLPKRMKRSDVPEEAPSEEPETPAEEPEVPAEEIPVVEAEIVEPEEK